MTPEEFELIKISTNDKLSLLIKTLNSTSDDRDTLDFLHTVLKKQYSIKAMRGEEGNWTIVKIDELV